MNKIRAVLGAGLAATMFTGVFASPARAADTTGPTISVYYEEAENYVSVWHQPSVYLSDPDGVSYGELLLNGELVTKFADFGPLWPLDTPNGPATMTIRAYDRAGHTSEYTRNIVVDSDQPVVGLAPANGKLVRGVVSAAVTSVRDQTGLGKLESAIVGGAPNVRTRKAPWSIPLDTRKVTDGKHGIFFAVSDKAGNAVYAERTVYVDNTLPSLSITKAPKNKAKVSGKFGVVAKAGDKNGVAKVQLLINGKVVGTDTKAGWAFTVNPKKYGKKFTLRLRAYDKAGNVRYSTVRTYRH
ncbi:Ig-like domain-containing protein [Actinoplanes sp. L3-i22]|uniref:Ig-like domain-containing protein n=1 Tax=Actinoplanes sp. L3-i22 TaxID=2836373 RepID=UPI001C776DD2|nr:Ig-like domain-containing protein [Actinoplanes sp. L3-i22]BCY15465.1 hypothetical protein L3i22_105530 [Actinoplanes sp. L3-i22]